MLLRIFRARLRPGREEQALHLMREVTEQLAKAPGLHAIYLGRRLDDDVQTVEVVSVWRDAAAIANTMGSRWQRPYLPGNLADLVDQPTVHHTETILEYPPDDGDDPQARAA